uniref:Uncharacterized protein n=1 Tax=Trieres chinensis TaxID=1514140 RepID=A0A7S1ZDC1_TRICV|mmetsp:Transcript_22694/g.45998  ORF Transcript_22694/g.45998 Transcript_22694/m.45998 type:complete len:304 (+) Transcript_22694:103-1014(+)
MSLRFRFPSSMSGRLMGSTTNFGTSKKRFHFSSCNLPVRTLPFSQWNASRLLSNNTGGSDKDGDNDALHEKRQQPSSDDRFDADGPFDHGYHNPDDRFIDGKPTLAYVKAMPMDYSSMRHEQIFQLAAEGHAGARQEMLIRTIMATDSVEYDDAVKTFEKIAADNRKGMFWQYMPHKLGFFSAITAGTLSIPLVFHYPTVEKFNELYVTAEVPQPSDLDTWLEVGSWSWAWMEPLIGQASFFLLAMAFARAQLINMGIKPFTGYLRDRRAQLLVKKYSKYQPTVLEAFSRSDQLYTSSNVAKE